MVTSNNSGKYVPVDKMYKKCKNLAQSGLKYIKCDPGCVNYLKNVVTIYKERLICYAVYKEEMSVLDTDDTPFYDAVEPHAVDIKV